MHVGNNTNNSMDPAEDELCSQVKYTRLLHLSLAVTQANRNSRQFPAFEHLVRRICFPPRNSSSKWEETVLTEPMEG